MAKGSTVSSCQNEADDRMETYCGTTGYASPEMLAGRKYLGIETDVWSLGIILYTLLAGGLPFDDDNESVMKDLILKGEYEEPEWITEGKPDPGQG
jgi:serine/threonine protein kinase